MTFRFKEITAGTVRFEVNGDFVCVPLCDYYPSIDDKPTMANIRNFAMFYRNDGTGRDLPPAKEFKVYAELVNRIATYQF